MNEKQKMKELVLVLGNGPLVFTYTWTQEKGMNE